MAYRYPNLTQQQVNYISKISELSEKAKRQILLALNDGIPSPGGAEAFTELTDTPADYVGQAGRFPAVYALPPHC